MTRPASSGQERQEPPATGSPTGPGSRYSSPSGAQSAAKNATPTSGLSGAPTSGTALPSANRRAAPSPTRSPGGDLDDRDPRDRPADDPPDQRPPRAPPAPRGANGPAVAPAENSAKNGAIERPDRLGQPSRRRSRGHRAAAEPVRPRRRPAGPRRPAASIPAGPREERGRGRPPGVRAATRPSAARISFFGSIATADRPEEPDPGEEADGSSDRSARRHARSGIVGHRRGPPIRSVRGPRRSGPPPRPPRGRPRRRRSRRAGAGSGRTPSGVDGPAVPDLGRAAQAEQRS